jgi:hypothetical protein
MEREIRDMNIPFQITIQQINTRTDAHKFANSEYKINTVPSMVLIHEDGRAFKYKANDILPVIRNLSDIHNSDVIETDVITSGENKIRVVDFVEKETPKQPARKEWTKNLGIDYKVTPSDVNVIEYAKEMEKSRTKLFGQNNSNDPEQSVTNL